MKAMVCAATLVAVLLACTPVPDPSAGLVVDASAPAPGDGSECFPFQSLAEGLEVAGQLPAATVRVRRGDVQVGGRDVVSCEVTAVGAPSNLTITGSVTIHSGAKLLLRSFVLRQPAMSDEIALKCVGGVLSLAGVVLEGGNAATMQIAEGAIEVRNSTFSYLPKVIIEVLSADTSIQIETVSVYSSADIISIASTFQGTVEMTIQDLSVTQSGRLCYSKVFSGLELRLLWENGTVSGNAAELFSSDFKNSTLQLRNITMTNSQQVMTGRVINSTIAFTNCTFRQGKSSLIDLSSFLGDITFHNSTVTELQGPLVLIPANQYHYSLARISISSCRISKFINSNVRVTGGIANIASTSLAIRDSEIWGGNVSRDGLFTLTSGFASIDNLYFHDSSALSFSLYEAALSVVELANVVAIRLNHTASRFSSCILGTQCLWTNVSITDSRSPNPQQAVNSFTMLWSGFGGNSTVLNSYFRNIGRSFPCMGPTDGGRLAIINSTFADLNNTTSFVTLSDSQLIVSNVTLVNPTVVLIFGCYYSVQCLEARQVKVQGNSSISAVIGGEGAFAISDSVFAGVYYSHFVARGGSLTVNNVTATSSTGFLCRECVNTNITFNSLSVVDSVTPYIFQAVDCSVTITDFVVSNITALQFFSLEASKLVMRRGVFANVKVDSFGGVLTATDSAVYFDSVSLSNVISSLSIRIGLLHIYNCKLEIVESTFTRFNSTLVYAFESFITIRKSTFIEGGMYNSSSSKSVLSYGGVLWSENSPSIIIDACTFQKLSSDYGGVLYLSGSDTETCCVSNSSASLSSARQKGGFAYISKVKTSITNSTAFNNSANYGGAIWAGGDRGELLLTIDNSQFTNNTATLEGGALQTIQSSFYSKNNQWDMNSAIYGPNFASAVSKLSVVQSLVHTPLDNFIITVASGQVYKETILIACLDELDQVVTTEQSTKLTLSAENSTVIIPILLEAKSGLFTIPSVAVIGKPISVVKVSAELGEKLKQQVFTVQLRECAAGEFFIDSRCDLCTHNTYSFTPSQPCRLCPVHADCPLGFRLDLHSGHWRANNMTDVIYDCIVPELCLGGFDSECEKGHSRVMCARCDDRYFKVNQLQCIECSHKAVSVFKAIFTFIVSTASIVYSQFLDEQTQMIHIVIFDYLQSVRILENFNIYWPKSLAYLYSVIGDIGSVGLTAFTDSCFGAITGIHQVYSQLIVAALYFTLFLFVIGLICFGIKERYKKFGVGRMISVVFYFGYLLLPLLFVRMLQMFACFHVGEKYYLIYDSSEECWTHQHLSYSFAIALPILLLTLMAALAFFAVSLIPKVSYQQPYLKCLAIFLIRKCTLSALLIFSNAWAFSSQVSIALCVNIATEILLYKFTSYQESFYFSLYQSSLIASTAHSFFCVLYGASESPIEDKEGPFIGVNYMCVSLPLFYGVFVLVAKPRKSLMRVQTMQCSEGATQTTGSALKVCSEGSLGVSELPLHAPNSSFASVDVSSEH